MFKLNEKKLSSSLREKFKIDKNSLVRCVKNDNSDRIEVEIGDTKSDDFKPQFKFMRWDNEVNFSLRSEERPDAVVEIDGDIIKYITLDYEVHQYEKHEAGEDGGFEFEWLLPRNPSANVLTATIKTKGLVFFYQPPLTDEQLANGYEILEEGVGSYAVYHESRKDHRVGEKNYKTGKAFHIYRPKATDANGSSIWCEISIDTNQEELKVTVPANFLDSAAYPVKVDPTFGYTSAGISAQNNSDVMRGWGGTMSEDGTVTMISANYSNNSTRNAKCAIYDGPSGTATLMSPQSTENLSTTNGWNDFSVSSLSLTNGVGYHVLSWVEGPASGGVSIRHDTGGSGQDRVSAQSYAGSWPSPVAFTTGNTLRSIYATYTTGGGGDTQIPLRRMRGVGL